MKPNTVLIPFYSLSGEPDVEAGSGAVGVGSSAPVALVSPSESGAKGKGGKKKAISRRASRYLQTDTVRQTGADIARLTSRVSRTSGPGQGTPRGESESKDEAEPDVRTSTVVVLRRVAVRVLQCDPRV